GGCLRGDTFQLFIIRSTLLEVPAKSVYLVRTGVAASHSFPNLERGRVALFSRPVIPVEDRHHLAITIRVPASLQSIVGSPRPRPASVPLAMQLYGRSRIVVFVTCAAGRFGSRPPRDERQTDGARFVAALLARPPWSWTVVAVLVEMLTTTALLYLFLSPVNDLF